VSLIALREMIKHRIDWKPSRLKFALLQNDGGVWGDNWGYNRHRVIQRMSHFLFKDFKVSNYSRYTTFDRIVCSQNISNGGFHFVGLF